MRSLVSVEARSVNLSGDRSIAPGDLSSFLCEEARMELAGGVLLEIEGVFFIFVLSSDNVAARWSTLVPRNQAPATNRVSSICVRNAARRLNPTAVKQFSL